VDDEGRNKGTSSDQHSCDTATSHRFGQITYRRLPSTIA
jgi:hypothetical protein